MSLTLWLSPTFINFTHYWRGLTWANKETGAVNSFLPPFHYLTSPSDPYDNSHHKIQQYYLCTLHRRMAGNTSLSENYAFAGMYHIFDQHTEPGKSCPYSVDCVASYHSIYMALPIWYPNIWFNIDFGILVIIRCTMHKSYTTLYLGPKWHIFHIIASVDIIDIISCY